MSSEVVDVASAESVRKATTSALKRHDRIDILVANAGIAGPNLKAWEYPLDAWKQVIDINRRASLLLQRHHSYLLEQDDGRLRMWLRLPARKGMRTRRPTAPRRPE